jgi:divalent metal cation (Fe/Co/Zn/Cd) transporter
MGAKVFLKTSKDLMDANCAEAEKSIVDVLERTKGYLEYHDLKTRRSGSKVFMEVHLCVDGDVSVREAHELTDRIGIELNRAIPGIEPNIHIEDQTQCQKHKSQGIH